MALGCASNAAAGLAVAGLAAGGILTGGGAYGVAFLQPAILSAFVLEHLPPKRAADLRRVSIGRGDSERSFSKPQVHPTK